MEKRGRTLKINLSNKLFYILIFLGILGLFGAVYAYNTPGPASSLGHSADELTGVCRTDGVGCTFPDSQADLGMYINPSNGQLCYPSSTSGSCALQSATCTRSGTTYYATSPTCSGPTPQQLCLSQCQGIVACNGDSTQWSCGTPGTVNYNQASVAACNGPTGDYLLTCTCSVSGVAYQNEAAQNARCI
mgnify:CR=1 FL=1